MCTKQVRVDWIFQIAGNAEINPTPVYGSHLKMPKQCLGRIFENNSSNSGQRKWFTFPNKMLNLFIPTEWIKCNQDTKCQWLQIRQSDTLLLFERIVLLCVHPLCFAPAVQHLTQWSLKSCPPHTCYCYN